MSALLVGVVVRGYGRIILLANNGLINSAVKKLGLFPYSLTLMCNAVGVGVGLVHVFLPFIILPILSSIQSIDPALEEAVQSLGASRARANVTRGDTAKLGGNSGGLDPRLRADHQRLCDPDPARRPQNQDHADSGHSAADRRLSLAVRSGAGLHPRRERGSGRLYLHPSDRTVDERV
jgi:hypothetical protein